MNMQAMLRQAQNLQKDMLKTKDEIDKTEFTGENGFVKITANGSKKVTKVEISKEMDLSSDDLEVLEDMILLAINDVNKKIDDVTEKKMGKYTNGMPRLF